MQNRIGEFVKDLSDVYYQIVSRNESSYPITISDVKVFSQYFKINPDDQSQNDFITQRIKMDVNNFEDETKYILLDTTFKLYYNDPRTSYFGNYIQNYPAKCFLNGLRLSSLNLRLIDHIKYYELNTKDNDDRVLLSSSNYYLEPELMNTPSIIRIKENNSFELANTNNSIEIQYKAGFANNVFTSMPEEIKIALAQLVAYNIDVKNQICNDQYSDNIRAIYDKYRKFNITQFIY
jgi:hypothetical protein